MDRIKGAIFDLDGTLFDSSTLWEDIDRRFLEERGLDAPPGYIDALNAMSFKGAAEYTISLFHLPETPEELISVWNGMARDAYRESVGLKSGSKELLLSLREKGLLIAAATDLDKEIATACLESNGILSFFSSIATTGEAGRDKSHPDVYLMAAEAISLQAAECIVFEDSLTGLKSAKAAGFATAAVYDIASSDKWEEMKAIADYSLPTLEEK